MSLWDPPKGPYRDPLPFMEIREFTPEERAELRKRVDDAIAELKKSPRVRAFGKRQQCTCPCHRRY